MSKRENRKQFYTEKEKEYTRDYNKYQELWEKRKENEVWIKLDKPVPFGYIRYFVLRKDIAVSKKGDDIQYLLDNFLQNQWWSHTKKFKKRQSSVRRRCNKYWQLLWKKTEQKLENLSEKQWNKLDSPFYKFFDKTEKEKRSWDNVMVYSYVFKFPWMFQYKIEQDYYTHQRLPQGEIDSEIDRLSTKLWYQGSGAHFLDRFRYTDPWKDVEKHYRKASEKRMIQKEINDGLDENQKFHINH